MLFCFSVCWFRLLRLCLQADHMELLSFVNLAVLVTWEESCIAARCCKLACDIAAQSRCEAIHVHHSQGALHCRLIWEASEAAGMAEDNIKWETDWPMDLTTMDTTPVYGFRHVPLTLRNWVSSSRSLSVHCECLFQRKRKSYNNQ